MSNPAAFLFDLDGTLVDTEISWARAMVNLLADRGVATSLDEVATVVFGHSWFDIHAILSARYPDARLEIPETDAPRLRAYYDRIVTDPATLIIASSVEFLRKCAEVAPVAIVSGSPSRDVAKAAELCGIDHLLKFVLGAEDYPHGKPAPDGYLRAAEMLGVDPAECVVVEDSSAGVASGVAAGMRVIGLDRNPYISQQFEGAELVVRDLGEISLAKLRK